MSKDIWNKLCSKKYRDAFVLQAFKRVVPFQISVMRKQRHWSQEQLAREAGLTQGVISRAEDPDYGKLTINTICRIAAGFDVAFIGKFVPFSELDRWFSDLSEKSVQVPNFQEENSVFEEALGKVPEIDPKAKQEYKQPLGSVFRNNKQLEEHKLARLVA